MVRRNPWDCKLFGNSGKSGSQVETPERVPLVFEKNNAGHHSVDKWTINGKQFPKTDPIRVKAGGRYHLVFDNRSNEAHQVDFIGTRSNSKDCRVQPQASIRMSS